METEARNVLRDTSIGGLVSLITQVTGGSVEEHVIRSQVHRLREEHFGPVIRVVETVYRPLQTA